MEKVRFDWRLSDGIASVANFCVLLAVLFSFPLGDDAVMGNYLVNHWRESYVPKAGKSTKAGGWWRDSSSLT
jgi:hypothetical protein